MMALQNSLFGHLPWHALLGALMLAMCVWMIYLAFGWPAVLQSCFEYPFSFTDLLLEWRMVCPGMV